MNDRGTEVLKFSPLKEYDLADIIEVNLERVRRDDPLRSTFEEILKETAEHPEPHMRARSETEFESLSQSPSQLLALSARFADGSQGLLAHAAIDFQTGWVELCAARAIWTRIGCHTFMLNARVYLLGLELNHGGFYEDERPVFAKIKTANGPSRKSIKKWGAYEFEVPPPCLADYPAHGGAGEYVYSMLDPDACKKGFHRTLDCLERGKIEFGGQEFNLETKNLEIYQPKIGRELAADIDALFEHRARLAAVCKRSMKR